MKRQSTKQTTTLEYDNAVLGKGKIKSNDIYIVWAGMFLMFGLAFFVIYSKYWHKPLVRRFNRKRRK